MLDTRFLVRLVVLQTVFLIALGFYLTNDDMYISIENRKAISNCSKQVQDGCPITHESLLMVNKEYKSLQEAHSILQQQCTAAYELIELLSSSTEQGTK